MKLAKNRCVELDPSVQLAWYIANREAALANCACITPSYVLLGVLKILDDSYDREVEDINMDAQELEQINQMVLITRRFLEMSQSELTAARRGLHKALPDNNTGQTPPRVRPLRWSGDTVYLHTKVVARAIKSGQLSITLIHLIEELLENLPREAILFFQQHPRARAAVSSSEDGQDEAQYDSLLWGSSEQRDKN